MTPGRIAAAGPVETGQDLNPVIRLVKENPRTN